MKHLLIVPLLFFTLEAAAQKIFRFAEPVSVSMEGNSLSMPFAGGINASQLQQMDVNGNGLEELVLWDRNAGNLLVFEKTDDAYIHNPVLSFDFPEDVNGFLILADFDGDGKKDLFTASPFGIKVYKNNQNAGGGPMWELAQDYLKLDNNANLQVNPLDIPAIQDIDGDGDLDIVTFNFASGDFLEYYQNTSIERKGEGDIDGFAPAISRWGGFEFCSCGDFSFGQRCDGGALSNSLPVEPNLRTEHAGGHTLLLRDFDADGVMDILMGQDECNTLYYLPNEGSNSVSKFNAFSNNLPQLGPLPEFPIFLGAHMVDQDLLITTLSSSSSSQTQADYSKSIYHYNSSSQLTTNAYLQEDMLDLGENTRPFFRGHSTSGELIVTANSQTENHVVGKAYRFMLVEENLELRDNDYLGLSSLNLLDLQFQEYLGNNHLPSVFVSGMEVVNFTPIRKLFWTPELSGENLSEVPVPEVSLRGNDHFQFFRYKGDDFMLLARQTGELVRYRVTFEPFPRLELLDRNFLGFSDNPVSRNLNVHVHSQPEDKIGLYTIDQRGVLSYIADFQEATNSVEILINLPDDNLSKTRLGRNTWMATIPAAFGEKADLILGNAAGGLIYLQDISTDQSPTDPNNPQIKIFPNPTLGPLSILASETGQITLINMLGQEIWSEIPIEKNIQMELDLYLSPGVYLLNFTSSTGKKVVKKVLLNKL